MARYWSTTFQEAKASGQKYYRSDRPCRRGHMADRFVSTKQCTECMKEREASLNKDAERIRKRLLMRRRRNNPDVREKERQYNRANAAASRDRCIRRYARQKKVFIEDVPLEYLMKRDAGQCRLCGTRLSLSTKFPHPRSPTRDHIIPLTRGGTHERRNVQLVCYACNLSKGNGSRGEQLLLVG